MTSRHTIRGILHKFLGTFASRYSDYEGYWVFGLLVKELEGTTAIDLLHAATAGATPTNFAARHAVSKFVEQVHKAGLSPSCIREAELTITRSTTRCRGDVNGRTSDGYAVTFVATATSDLGRTYESQTVLFVAPHDPFMESRSGRAR